MGDKAPSVVTGVYQDLAIVRDHTRLVLADLSESCIKPILRWYSRRAREGEPLPYVQELTDGELSQMKDIGFVKLCKIRTAIDRYNVR